MAMEIPLLGFDALPSTPPSLRADFPKLPIGRGFRFPKSLSPKIRSVSCKTISSCSSSSAAVASSPLHLDAVKKKAMELSPDFKGTSIFLVGMKSSAKRDLAKILAHALRYYYFDSDSLVEEAAGGASAAKSYRQIDAKGFRESETEVLRQLSSMGRLVVCAGDGAVQSSTNLSLLRHGISIWVDVPIDIIAQEMTGYQSDLDASRMSISESFSKVVAQLTAVYEENREGYATADAAVSLQNIAVRLGYDELCTVTIEEMALEVLREIHKLTRVKKMMEEAGRPF